MNNCKLTFSTPCIALVELQSIFFLKKLFLTFRINLFMLREISQSENDKYHMISLICGI